MKQERSIYLHIGWQYISLDLAIFFELSAIEDYFFYFWTYTFKSCQPLFFYSFPKP